MFSNFFFFFLSFVDPVQVGIFKKPAEVQVGKI